MQLSENVLEFLKANGIDLNSTQSQRATKLQQFLDDEADEATNSQILNEAIKGGHNPDEYATNQRNEILLDQLLEAIENYQENKLV